MGQGRTGEGYCATVWRLQIVLGDLTAMKKEMIKLREVWQSQDCHYALRGMVTMEKGHGASVSAMKSYKTNAPVGLMD